MIRHADIMLFTQILLVLMLAAPQAIAGGGVDKSGLKPQVLSLPSGPGSIEGLGESFEPQLNTGTASYRVPLKLPPGRVDFAPALALVYNGGSGNGLLGMGWRFSLAYIQRQTDKGLPVYDDVKDTFITDGGEELVPVGDGKYRCENETTFDRFERTGEAWKASHKDGSISYYGLNRMARVENNGHIFRWRISKQEDTNGNQILYNYNEVTAFSDGVLPDDGQAYITSIAYNHSPVPGSAMRVEFKYHTREVHDRLFDYRSRFPVQTTQRCTEIVMYAGDQRVRSYKLVYAPQTILSRLSRIEMYGRDETQGPLESILSFGYTEFALNSLVTAMNTGVNPGVGLALADVDLVDMNGDALPDLIHTGDVHEVFINNDGRAWNESYNVPGGFTEIRLRHPNTMLMDMDGDGFSDLFSQDLSIDGYRYFRGGQANNGWAFIPVEMHNSPGFVFGDITKPVDLDNDGRTDVIWKAEFASEIACVFNEGGIRMSGVFSVDAPSMRSEFNFGSEATSGLRLADMNGDGLQDFLVLNGEGQIWYYPGHGVTSDPATPWQYQGWDNTPRGAWAQGDTSAEGYRMAHAPDSFDDPDFTEVDNFRNLKVLDINGDGMSDLVYVSNNRLLAWLNMGGHAFSPDPYVVLPEACQIPDQSPETHVRTVDMNANGTMDVVWNRQTGFSEIGHPESSWVYLDLTGGLRPNLLQQIDNGIGQVTTIEYKSSTEYLVADRSNGQTWNHRVPFPVNVVARIEVFDGRDSTYIRQMSYHNGYYDGEEKEFRGFAKAEQRELGDMSAPDLIMAYTYDTGAVQEALKGKTLALEACTEEGSIFHREEYTWVTRVLAEGMQGDERKVTFPYQQAKIRDVLEKGSGTPVQLKWEYEYDDYGNMTCQKEYGRMDTDWDDERVTQISYTASYPSGLSRWMLDKVVERTTTDETGTLVARQRNYYDGYLALGEVSKGNLTRTEDWVAGDTYVVSVRNDYDTYGNIIAAYDPLYGSEPGHYRDFTYDETFHTFPVEERIHTGSLTLTMSVTYDPGWGVMKTSIDFNGFTTYYGYDTFGRLTSITKPPDTGHTVEYDYVLAHDLSTTEGKKRLINWVETQQRDGSSGDGFLHSRTFYDGLGRKIMTREEGESSGQVVVSDTVKFNARKTVWKKYLPYFASGLDFQEPTFGTGFTEHHYDALGREVRVIQPGELEFSETFYKPLIKEVKDEEQTKQGGIHGGCMMRYIEDGLQDEDGNGRLRVVEEVVKTSDIGEPLDEPTTWATTYSYDLLGNLTGYVDSQGNSKLMVYDGLGRKTFMNDPDRGHMDYTYDDAGNLVQTVDAKGQVIRSTYDGANRITAEYYGKEKAEPDVEYHYDLPAGPLNRGDLWEKGPADLIADAILNEDEYNAEYDRNQDGRIDVADVVKAARESGYSGSVAAENTLGFLSWVRDQSGEEHNSYDARGRVQWVVKSIIDTGSGYMKNFYTATEYDSMDRMTKLIYPDATYATYTYNSRGLLESVPNVIGRYDYNPAGQNELLELACGTVTTYDYDYRLRLSHLHTIRSHDELSLQDLTYTYDAVSDITHIEDGRDTATLEKIGMEIGIGETESRKFNASQYFTYDSLYRLTQASNPSVYGTINYRYDRIGNMIAKNASLTDPDPLMDLGLMTSGGSMGMGSWDRIGRNPGDAPGPHAVTGIEKGPEGPMIFSYDDNGNMTSVRNMSLVWDYKDRLAGLTNGTKTAHYLYDYTGTRRNKTVMDAENSWIAEVFYVDKFCEVREGKLIKYVYAGDNRIARSETATITSSHFQPLCFYLHDHLGSSNLTLSSDGCVTAQFVNYPFGHRRREKTSPSQLVVTDYKFTGKERDAESDLQYFEARYLSGHIGRFINVDPSHSALNSTVNAQKQKRLSNPQDLGTYAYVGNNPLNFQDDNGKDRVETITKIMPQAAGAFRQAKYALTPGEATVALGIAGRLVGSIVGCAAFGPVGGVVGGFVGGIAGGMVGSLIDEQQLKNEMHRAKVDALNASRDPRTGISGSSEIRVGDLPIQLYQERENRAANAPLEVPEQVHPDFEKRIEAQKEYNKTHPISSDPKKFNNSGQRIYGKPAN